jgi:hypothetical protein
MMRKLIALVFNYSLNGLLADEGSEYLKFCFDLPDLNGGPDRDEPGAAPVSGGRSCGST